MTPQTIPLDIVGVEKPSKYRQVSNEQTYNFYISNNSLFPTPGYKKASTKRLGNTGRAIFNSNLLGQVVAVYDEKVYVVGENIFPQLLNSNIPLETTKGNVSIAENMVREIAISDNVNVYIYNNIDKTFSVATLPDGVIPGKIVFQDSRFLLQDRNSNRWYTSGLNNGLLWNAEEWTTIRETTSGIAVVGRAVMVFGKSSSSVFYDQGAYPFPYIVDNSTIIEYGCLSPDSISELSGYVCWLGSNKQSTPVILISTGGSPLVLGDENINYKLTKLIYPNDSEGFLYEQSGRLFYQITFRKDKLTLLYDFQNKAFSILTTEKLDYFPIRQVAQFSGKHYAITSNDGYIYEFSNDIYTADSELIPRIRQTSNYSYNEQKVCVRELMLSTTGGSTMPSEGYPICRLRVSKDKGISYPIINDIRLARAGEYTNIVRFRNLGSSRHWTFRFEFRSDQPIVVMGGEMTVM